MRVHTDFENIGSIKNAVVTTGTFDGVHIGHKTILNRLNQLAAEINGESVLITFQNHPAKVLNPRKSDKTALITTKHEKIELLRNTGIDHLFIIPFTPEFAKITSHSFVNDILKNKLHARVVIVGFNHHFGYNRQGNFNYLHQISKNSGFMVEEIPMQDIEKEMVSSTQIRKALKGGNIEQANLYLDHLYLLSAKTLKKGSFSQLQNNEIFELVVDDEEKIIPSDGAYKVKLQKHQIEGTMFINRDTGNTQLFFMPERNATLIQNNMTYNYVFYRKLQHINHIKKQQTFISEHIQEVKTLSDN
jgi:riboflavin kinase / FMN adenylyltransferase